MKTEIKTAIIFSILILILVIAIAFFYNNTEFNSNNAVNVNKSNLLHVPSLTGATGYINTSEDELNLLLKNNVVLYDFWTYSCINCIRTLPHITAWSEKYANEGLVIVGIHSPEFQFEKEKENVMSATKQFGIDYPVVLDNKKEIWKEFQNNYWPRKYIADHEGYIRYDHIGEGSYKETEQIIQKLLNERAIAIGITPKNLELETLNEFEHSSFRTPELYFGYKFAAGRNQLGNPEGFKPEMNIEYTIPEKISQNYFYLEGIWKNNKDSMQLISDTGKIILKYNAKQVNIVAKNNANLEISVDDMTIPDSISGGDLNNNSRISVFEPRLYNIINSNDTHSHELIIKVNQPDFEIFTFTFG